MIRVHITPGAFKAIAARVPGAADIDQQRQSGSSLFGVPPAGMVPIWLPKEAVNAFKAMRKRGESISDVILRFVA
jgi:hypothetical protein